jgi:hypothetical protein
VAYAPLPPAAADAPSAPVVHAPLPPAAGYVPPVPRPGYAAAPPPPGYASSAPPMIPSPRPPAPYGNSTYARSEPQTAGNLVWRTSPRWATIRGKDHAVAKQDPQAKFKAAQAKAAKVGVENLSKDDVDGLSLAQLKELRGY